MSEKRSEHRWNDYGRELGVNLQRARQVTGLSQAELAHQAGISPNTYQRYEKGESGPGTPINPRLETLVALSYALGVPLSKILPENPPDPRGRSAARRRSKGRTRASRPAKGRRPKGQSSRSGE